MTSICGASTSPARSPRSAFSKGWTADTRAQVEPGPLHPDQFLVELEAEPGDPIRFGRGGHDEHELPGVVTHALATVEHDHRKAALPSITDPATHISIDVGARSLTAAALIRNHVLHARPATVDGKQVLFRWTIGGRPGMHASPITQEWLDNALRRLVKLSEDLQGARPPLPGDIRQ